MKRISIITLALLLLGGSALAQNHRANYQFRGFVFGNDALSTQDLFSLSQSADNFGTARSMGMAGAFVSLGADMAAIAINPAGLGMYQRSEVSLTPSLSFTNISTPGALAPSQGMPMRENDKTTFALNNLGAAITLYEGSGNLLSLTLGVGFNRLADYNYNASFEYRHAVTLDDEGNYISLPSVADALALQLEAGGATVGQHGIEMDGYENWGIDPYFWSAVAGYKSYMLEQNAYGLWYPAQIGVNADIGGGASMTSRGSASEFNIALGGNISNKLYFGLTIGIQSITRRQTFYYGEGYSYGGGNGYNTGEMAIYDDGTPLNDVMQGMGLSQTMKVDGSGVNFKLGLIYRPIESLRLGMAIHTPTFYSLNRYYYMGLSTEWIGATDPAEGDMRPHEYFSDQMPEYPVEDVGEWAWRFYGPTRLMFGASYSVGHWAMFSVDYERDWYNGIRVKNQPSLYYGQNEEDFKQDFKHLFKGSNSVRVGVEVRPVPIFALRAGYGYTGSALRDEKTTFNSPAIYQTNYCTAGIGFSLGSLAYIDLAYRYSANKMTSYYLFMADKYVTGVNESEYYESDLYTSKMTRHQVALTFGFRF